MPSFDEALQRAGEFGRFQRRVFLLLCLTGVTFAFLFVGVVFLGSRPERYWCRGPSAAALAERCGWSPEEEWNRTAPPERGGDAGCRRYLLEAANGSAAAGALSCADPLAAFPNRSAPLVPCRGGWRYVQAHSTIVSEFDLVCVNAWMLDLTQAVLNLGFLAGAFTLGYAADRFTSAVVYQGLVMRLGIIGGNLYIDFFISGVVELPAALLILLTIERFGRRLPFAGSNMVAGVACLVTAFLPEGIPWLRTTVATLGRLGITMAFEIVYLVNSELYPTTLRNFGVSLCSGLCDFGGIIAPFLLFRLAAIWLELPLIIFGILASVCGGLVMLLPETKGIALPETVDDVEKLGSPYSYKCGRRKKTQVCSSHL
ncbi:solute carrier family 22 member 3 isoform X2 [Panthera pardus]|uniref:Solute carrier family 22 member 3 isoform X2 n=1 Tax=Panthera pardus TaxID=9691 RepID=A0A9V1DVF9_PANPR|nr:solute carrier family 22 member 3 isoform X2 [Panthera pardus]XP_058591817.1 solute carrier family 22 member 3 isoform X2 [Neofelis nebulosa]XP_060473026.1 solute carrier family 22 member 3 isoform X2 [Panthera onca]